MKELEASLKMIIPLEGDIIDRRYTDFEGTANFKDLMLSGAKVDFVLRTKSDKLSRYRSGSWRSRDKNPFYKPGVYQLATSLKITKFGKKPEW